VVDERSRRARLWLVWLALLLAGTLGCGPMFYTVNILPASSAVEQAREAGAPDHAPYEYYFAEANLQKAKEEASRASYQDAIRFAEAAEQFGTKARDLARRRMREMGR
jgi:hypothetical protein